MPDNSNPQPTNSTGTGLPNSSANPVLSGKPISSPNPSPQPSLRVTNTASATPPKTAWVPSTPSTPTTNPTMNTTGSNMSTGSRPFSTPGVAPTVTPAQGIPSAFKQSAPVAANTAAIPPKGGTPVTSENPGQPKKSILRFLPFALLGAVVVSLIGGAGYWFMKNRSASSQTGTNPNIQNKQTIVYWGLWEPTTNMQQVLADFEVQNPGFTVQYVQQSHQEYRERLQADIAKGTGPDVFRFHASWVPMMKNELSPLPEKVMTTDEFTQTFYPIATQQLAVNNEIVGMPLMIDGLGLYYNKDIFNIANLTPPKNWEEMKKTAADLTIKAGGKITRGGIAMGTASNVEHFSEIIALLMLQNGADPANPTTAQAQEALNFYLDFATKLAVWDTTLPNATVAFAKGDVAMMLAPSWRAHEIKAANPNLQFDIVPVPQLPDKERTTWASFWAEGVSTQSKQKEGAWLLLKYLSSADVQQKLYSDASTVRAFGELYSRKDLADKIANQPYVGAYIQDAPYAKSWYLNAYTHDNGINDRIIKYYEDAINAGQGALSTSVVTVQQGMTQVLGQYGVVTAQPAPVTQ